MNEIKNRGTKVGAIDSNEFSVAEHEAISSADAYIHKFLKPINYQGKTYAKLVFDWGTLTGEDGLAIENEMQQLGKPVIVPTLSGEYLVRMAARACTEPVGSDIFKYMTIGDYNRIRSAARSFLLKSEL